MRKCHPGIPSRWRGRRHVLRARAPALSVSAVTLRIPNIILRNEYAATRENEPASGKSSFHALLCLCSSPLAGWDIRPLWRFLPRGARRREHLAHLPPSKLSLRQGFTENRHFRLKQWKPIELEFHSLAIFGRNRDSEVTSAKVKIVPSIRFRIFCAKTKLE